jgi:hypothetical protein
MGNGDNEIEISEEHDHHRRAEAIRKVGRVGMLVIVVAGVSGALGHGPVSKRSAASAHVKMEYEGLARYNAPQKLKLRVKAASEKVQIAINSKFLEQIDIEHIDPQPAEFTLTDKGQVWTFPVANTNGEALITINFRPDGYGSNSGELAVDGAEPLQIRQFYFP